MITRSAQRLASALATLWVAASPAFASGDESIVVGDFSHAIPGSELPASWVPVTFPRIERHTRYTVTRDAQAGVVVCAEADASASGLARHLDLPAASRPMLRWRWKAQNLLTKGDVTRKDGDDYPTRVYISFKYSPERLSVAARLPYATARVLYGEYPPHAVITYVWDTRAPVETTVPNAFSDRSRMIVVESGTTRLGQWLAYERDVVADYRRAFGEEPPPIAGVAIMTDTDNTGESASACYGDIELAPR